MNSISSTCPKCGKGLTPSQHDIIDGCFTCVTEGSSL